MTTSLTKPANLSIDFVILCHNEPEVFNLIKHLQQYKQQQDRILILLDKSTDDYYKKLKQSNVNKIVKHNLDHDYSFHRNTILPHLKNDYCLALDADEQPTQALITNLSLIIHNLLYPDIIGIPRLNNFLNVTPIDCLKYGWTLSEGKYVNWVSGDYQYRLFKTGKGIKWKGVLHETLDKDQHTIRHIPKDKELCLIHNKTIERQRASNDLYNKQYTIEENCPALVKPATIQ